MDIPHYPTEKELQRIKEWDWQDFHGLMQFVRELWSFADWGFEQQGNTYYISTAGWSGNQSIISAMRENMLWWSMYWVEERKGGHFVFSCEDI